MKRINAYLPEFLRDRLLSAKEFYRRSIRPYRTKGSVTRVLGCEFERNRDFVEIDVTYVCNLRCPGCNRSCAQAPTAEMMTLTEVEKFTRESIRKDYRWKRIRIVGGEPTLHPQIAEIMKALAGYKHGFSPETRLMLVTNGYAGPTQRVVAAAPPEIEIENSEKAPHKKNCFVGFNLAPIDDPVFKGADFSNGCKILRYCGTGLTPYGFYPCAIAGAIDRVFGFDLGRKELPSRDDKMLDLLDVFCRYCGHFKDEKPDVIEQGCSPTWKDAYEKYSKERTILKRYVP